MHNKQILVVGGAGYIGSHVNKMLFQRGYKTIVLDNLSQGSKEAVKNGVFIEGDLSNLSLLDRIFKENSIDAVMHFAALTNVGESMVNPLMYYQNNVQNTFGLLEMMKRNHVNAIIFSSTAAVYGQPLFVSMAEDHPLFPINPYGRSKLMVEQILQDMSTAHDLKYCCLRYFNAAGGDPEGQIKYFKKESSNLIPKILKTLLQGKGEATIYGTDYSTADGTCIRDYIHIADLGLAHITAMEKIFEGANSNIYNLGNGQGFSVRQVINAVEIVTGKRINVTEGARRAGDPAILVSNAEKAHRELNWEPQYPSLEVMIDHAWRACN